MNFGIAVTTSVTPAVTELHQKEYIDRVRTVSELAGFDSFWVSDRTVYPAALSDRYPTQFENEDSTVILHRFCSGIEHSQ